MPVRKIYFYRAYIGSESDGRARVYDPGPPLRHITGLSFANGDRYLDADEDNAFACWPDRITRPSHVRMGKIRRSDLPQVEREGDLQDLDIPANSGLIEQAHFAFFGDNVVGMVFNFYGPRAGSLAQYLREKHAESSSVLRLDSLMRRDVLDQLDRLGEIRLLALNISRSYADTVREADGDLGAAFDAGFSAGRAEQMEVVLKPARHSRGWLRGGLKETLRTLVQTNTFREEVYKCAVRGWNEETGKLETVNLLRDHLVSEKDIPVHRGRSRGLIHGEAYHAIEEAYSELQGQIEMAVSLS